MEVGWSLRELAAENEPPLDLDSWSARLRQAGATECVVAGEVNEGAFVESASAEAARLAPRAAIYVQSRRVTVAEEIDWDNGRDAFGAAFRAIVSSFQDLDRLARFRFAATDMRIATDAAEALIDARENDGPARLYERVIETGLVVTYARAFLESNEAGIGRRWWPQSDTGNRELHDELIELRNEYHAHASHTPRRALENLSARYGLDHVTFSESWEVMSPANLRRVAQLAERLAAAFQGEADRIEADLAERLK